MVALIKLQDNLGVPNLRRFDGVTKKNVNEYMPMCCYLVNDGFE